MSIAVLAAAPEDAPRRRIIEAAERAFARHGFRGATMQFVAAEVRMSAGNLYRCLRFEETLVSGSGCRVPAGRARPRRSGRHA